MAATEEQRKSLQRALSYDHAPWCSGAISPPPEGFYLYYGRHNPKFIDLASATLDGIEQLSAACELATFGRGDQDVYDETYRKAVKMDAKNFSVQFDPVRLGLIKTIEEQLLPTHKEDMSISAEIYKLNVYGQDSFFKAHRDTPRGTDMLGSLVIVFPTPHQGGELVLRHKAREWTFDANHLMSLRPPTSLAYVAFYSDIEHEVRKITNGYRVTITYNLYLTPSRANLSTTINAVTPDPTLANSFRSTLKGLLDSPEFLPDGGALGFGLVHLYPVTFRTVLEDLIPYLKGDDAHVFRVCQELHLEPALRMIYEDLEYEDDPDFGIMVDCIAKQTNLNGHEPCGVDYSRYLVEELGGIPVNNCNHHDSASRRLIEWFSWVHAGRISWISPFNERNQVRDYSMAHGNEVSVGYIYCSPCLIVEVPPPALRKQVL